MSCHRHHKDRLRGPLGAYRLEPLLECDAGEHITAKTALEALLERAA